MPTVHHCAQSSSPTSRRPSASPHACPGPGIFFSIRLPSDALSTRFQASIPNGPFPFSQNRPSNAGSKTTRPTRRPEVRERFSFLTTSSPTTTTPQQASPPSNSLSTLATPSRSPNTAKAPAPGFPRASLVRPRKSSTKTSGSFQEKSPPKLRSLESSRAPS